MPTDLSAQIRATLDAWAEPTAIVEFPEPLTEAQYADLMARFKAAQLRPNEVKVIELPPSPFDRMRDALLAVLDEHRPLKWAPQNPVECSCATDRMIPYPCPTVLAIAGKLGIEADDD